MAIKNKYPEPILDTVEGVCFLCKKRGPTEVHHVFSAANRKKSTQYGCVCHLCWNCHQGPQGVHFNQQLWNRLKALTQAEFEATFPELNFLQIFGRNYL